MKRIPDKIYLQFHGQDSCELPDTDLEQYDEESEVTWCEDRINDTDVEYIRKPIYIASKARQLIGLQVQFKDGAWKKWGEVVAYDEKADKYTIKTIAENYQVSPCELVGVYIPEEVISEEVILGYTTENIKQKEE